MRITDDYENDYLFDDLISESRNLFTAMENAAHSYSTRDHKSFLQCVNDILCSQPFTSLIRSCKDGFDDVALCEVISKPHAKILSLPFNLHLKTSLPPSCAIFYSEYTGTTVPFLG